MRKVADARVGGARGRGDGGAEEADGATGGSGFDEAMGLRVVFCFVCWDAA